METKYVRVPFEVELAKKITEKSINGRIVTNLGKEVRIICFDKLNEKYPIVGLRKDDNYTETALSFNLKGQCLQILEDNDLFLEVPEYMTFKDGDVIAYDGFDTISITMADLIRNVNNVFAHYYAELRNEKLHFYEEGVRDVLNVGARLATESEKQKLIDALKASKEPKAKECLKKLGIEVKHEFEFKPFDKVLVRGKYDDNWIADMFSHKRKDGKYVCIGWTWRYCIPYNEQTAHLLGTTENYE